MRVLIDILHPAHVHFFRHLVAEGSALGHEFLITSRDKEMTRDLLHAYGLEHRVLTVQRRGAGLAVELAERTAKLIAQARRFRPDVMLGIMGPAIAAARPFVPSKVIAFYDNESARTTNRVVYRLADAYVTPNGFRDRYGSKQVRYAGYHELAYLHPDRFTADRQVPLRHGIAAGERLFMVRFVGWWSSHDVGEKGFSPAGKLALVRSLAAQGRVLISSEGPLPDALRAYAYDLPPQDVHHMLARADLLVGESSTMASEACILGTHAVYLSRTGRGVNWEQEELYGHAHAFRDDQEDAALDRVRSLAARPDLKDDGLARRDRLIAASCDPTQAMIDLIQTAGLSRDSSRAQWIAACRAAFSSVGSPPTTARRGGRAQRHGRGTDGARQGHL